MKRVEFAEIALNDLTVGMRIWMHSYRGSAHDRVTYGDHRVVVVQRYEHGGIFAIVIEPWHGTSCECREMVEARHIMTIRNREVIHARHRK